MRNFFWGGLYLGVVMVAFGIYMLTMATMQEDRIAECKAKGGTPIVPSLWAHSPWDVKCLEDD